MTVSLVQEDRRAIGHGRGHRSRSKGRDRGVAKELDMNRSRSQLRSACILLAIATISGACAFATVKPATVTAPPQKYHSIVIGEVVGEKVSPELKAKFVNALKEKLVSAQAFDVVALSGQDDAPGPRVILTSTITEFDEGSGALRVLIGFGAGRAKVTGAFRLADEKQDLAQFSATRTYAGGLGIGGAGFVSMEELLNRLAATAAESVQKWARGEPLE